MTPFMRSAAGRSNEHFFKGTDFVLIVEGGKERDGSIETEGLDVLFWQEVFEFLRPDISISIKSVGSKIAALAEAQEIMDGVVHERIVAVDTDYDELMSKKLVHPRILYTYGYSVESDLWQEESLETILGRALQVASITQGVREMLRKLVADQKLGCRWVLRVDSRLYHTTGFGLCHQKKNLQSLFRCRKNKPPKFNKQKFRESLVNARAGVSSTIKPLPNASLDGFRWIYGKLLARILREVINFILKDTPKKKLKDDNQNELLLAVFRRRLAASESISEYYTEMMQEIA